MTNEYWWFSCQRHVHSPVTIPPLSQGGVQTREKMWRDKTWPGLDRTNNYIIISCNEHHDQETRTIKYRIGLVSSLWLILIWGQEMTERYDGVVSSKYHDHRKYNLGYDWNFPSKTIKQYEISHISIYFVHTNLVPGHRMSQIFIESFALHMILRFYVRGLQFLLKINLGITYCSPDYVCACLTHCPFSVLVEFYKTALVSNQNQCNVNSTMGK